MKWLILQSDGQHKGQDGWEPNWFLRECYAIKHALEANDQVADIWGLRHDNYGIQPNFESYDYIFCVENYEFDWLPDLSKIKNPKKLQWIIDLHCQNPEVYSRISKNVDIVLHSTKILLPDYEKNNLQSLHFWFPNAVDDRFFYDRNSEKTIDLCFVGSKNVARIEIIERLEQELGMKYFFATGEKMLEIISSTKVHFNKNIGVDANYRIFETIGLGSCLVTNYDSSLCDLGFIDNKNVIMYDNADQAKEKIHKHLYDGTWQDIARHGHQLSLQHTYKCRIADLLNKLQKLL